MIVRASGNTTTTAISGLEWRPNRLGSGRTGTRIDANGGCGVTEYLFNPRVGPFSGWLSVHLGQNDILTYLGDDEQVLGAVFVDCRAGSPTLHTIVHMEFSPDPRWHLFIERGIGHVVFNKTDVTVRVESELFASLDNPAFDFQNDSINFRLEDRLPAFTVNTLPLPPEAARFILASQQASLLQSPPPAAE